MYKYEVTLAVKTDIEAVVNNRPVFYDDQGKYYIDASKKDIAFQYYDPTTDSNKSETLDQICQTLYSTDFSSQSTQVAVEEEVTKVQIEPFSSKSNLFFRGTGKKVSVPANTTTDIEYAVPYPKAKINGVEMMYGNAGDSCEFLVLDTATGTYSTVPNYKLNQFGFAWNISGALQKEILPYDADLYQGMRVIVRYTNNTANATEVGVNYYIHEVTS